MAARGDEPTEPKAQRKVISAKTGAVPVEASVNAFAAQKPNPLADGGLGIKAGDAVELPMNVHGMNVHGMNVHGMNLHGKAGRGAGAGKAKAETKADRNVGLAARPAADVKIAAKPAIAKPVARQKALAPAVKMPLAPSVKILADP